MSFLFRRRPLAPQGTQFFLSGCPDSKCADGWFQVSWTPNWTGHVGVDAQRERRRLRGRWVVIREKQSGGARIFRRLAFSNVAAVDSGSANTGVAVQLTWDDEIVVLRDPVAAERSQEPVPLMLEYPRGLDWIQIALRLPRENAEGVLFAMAAFVFSVAAFTYSEVRTIIHPPSPAPAAMAQVPLMAAEPSVGYASAVPSQLAGWRIGSVGPGGGHIVLSTQGEKGSSGVALEVSADPSLLMTLRVRGEILAGAWSLRVDDHAGAPQFFDLAESPAVIMTGAPRYRVLVYSDDRNARLQVESIALSEATDLDLERLEVAWPTSAQGILPHIERCRGRWLGRFGCGESTPAVQAASAMAAWVHGRSTVGSRPGRLQDYGPLAPLLDDVSSNLIGSCGDYSSALLYLCRRVGITARPVQLSTRAYQEGRAPGDTHVLIEVFDQEASRWVLLDPTFNLMFTEDDGTQLGIAGLVERVRTGQPWHMVPIGPVKPGRSQGEYYLPFSELLYKATAPAVPELGEIGAIYMSDGGAGRQVEAGAPSKSR